MVRACANASALQCIMMTALQILEPVTRPRLVAPQYIALAFSGAISNPGALAAGVQGSTALRGPLSAGALTRTYPPLPNITGILVDPSQLIRCELRSSVLCWVYRETVLRGTSSCLRSCNQRFISSLDGGRSSRRRRGALANGVDDGRAALAKRSF